MLKSLCTSFLYLLILISCTATPVAETIVSPPPTALYVFGDSLSDRGNALYLRSLLAGTTEIKLAEPASEDGQAFSDGMLIVEHLAKRLNLVLKPAWRGQTPLKKDHDNSLAQQSLVELIWQGGSKRNFTDERLQLAREKLHQRLSLLASIEHPADGNNFAVAGATIGANYEDYLAPLTNATSLASQIGLFHYLHPEPAQPSDLFVIAIGGNDLLRILASPEVVDLDQLNNELSKVAMAARWAVAQLMEYGARRILFIGPPDIGLLPALSEEGGFLSGLSMAFEAGMMKVVSDLPVNWISLISLQHQSLAEWPVEKRDLACVERNDDFDFNSILVEPTIGNVYINGCDRTALAEGEFPFFDNAHGSAALYVKIFQRLLIQLPADWFVARGPGGE